LIKKFIASDIEKAQTKARRALGDNAVVLAIRDLPSGDIEVTAGDEASARDYHAQQAINPNMASEQSASMARPTADYQSHSARIDTPPPVPTAVLTDNESQNTNNSAQKKQGFFTRRKPAGEKRTPPPISTEPIENFSASPANISPEQPNHNENDTPNTPTVTPAQSSNHAHQFSPMGVQLQSKQPQPAPPQTAPPQAPPQPIMHNGDYGKNPPYTEQSQATEANKPLMPATHNPIDRNQMAGSRLNEPIEQKFSENALAQLRDRLSGQQQNEAPITNNPLNDKLSALLRPHAISERLLKMIVNSAVTSQVDELLYQLGMGLAGSFNYSPLRSTAAVPVMLVGPTGAGKTSCAAKLAAIALSEGDDATMITTDVGRAGAQEQFATYSDKLNIDCYAAETPDEISTIVREVQPGGALILDTPGISPYDAGDLAALKSFQTAIGAEPVLVLPASGDVNEFTDWAHAFRAFGVRSCIITKFDATRRVGAGLSAAFEGNMTLTYFSETPFISEGLLPASPEFLAYRLMASYPGRIVQK